MHNKKAYMLNELLLIIALVSILMMLSVKPIRQFFRGVLNTQNVFNRQTQVEALLKQLRQDTEHAASAFIQNSDPRLGGDILYLSGPDGTVTYQFTDDAAACIRGTDTYEWPLPHTTFEWRLLTIQDLQAIAVTTQQQRTRRGDDTPAFRGSHLFIVGLSANLIEEDH